MWSVYVLQSQRDNFLYVGMSEDVPRRFKEHCTGKVRSTKAHRPLRLAHVEKVGTIAEARKREK